MGLIISLSSLASRAVRASISSGGIRTIARNALSEERDDDGNIISKIWNGVNRFGGSLMSKTLGLLGGAFQFSWTALWSFTQSVSTFVWHFNFNASDAELDSQINSQFNGLAGQLGGTIGNALGWLACGAVPGAILFAFNEPMGLYVLEQVGEEALDELAGNLANLIKSTATSITKAATIYAYKNIRKLWREPDSVFVQKLKEQGIVDQSKIDKALADRNKPWSFAKATEDAIESIPNEFLRNFTEELVEEFFESCTEAGYVVANSVDSYLATQKLATQTMLGSEQTVEILLERDGSSITQTT